MNLPALVTFGIRLDGRPVVPPMTSLDLGNLARRDEETPLPGSTSAARRLVDNILAWLKTNRLGAFGDEDRSHWINPAAPGVGWGVVFHQSIPIEIRAEVDRLVDLRQGYPLEDWTGKDTLSSWLEKHSVDSLNRDVTSKLPYYILIIARPDQISFPDQFELSRLRAVGRLDLGSDPDAYRVYVDGVIAAESEACRKSQRVVLASTRHAGDHSLPWPASYFLPASADLFDKKQTPEVDLVVRDGASSSELKADLLPARDGHSPVLAFIAAPGVCFPINHPQQQAEQGSWITSDWLGGLLPRNAYLAAEDTGPDFYAPGCIFFSLASYGAGTSQKCEFARSYNLVHPAMKIEEDLARSAFSASLPTRLLSQRVEGATAGALAFAGFSDLCWASNQPSPDEEQGGAGLYQTFLRRILQGETIGMAVSHIPAIVQSCNTSLAGYKDKLGRYRMDYARAIGSLWITRCHARGFILLGDPAAKISRIMGEPDKY